MNAYEIYQRNYRYARLFKAVTPFTIGLNLSCADLKRMSPTLGSPGREPMAHASPSTCAHNCGYSI
jgi:hypothetical protein